MNANICSSFLWGPAMNCRLVHGVSWERLHPECRRKWVSKMDGWMKKKSLSFSFPPERLSSNLRRSLASFIRQLTKLTRDRTKGDYFKVRPLASTVTALRCGGAHLLLGRFDQIRGWSARLRGVRAPCDFTQQHKTTVNEIRPNRQHNMDFFF